MGAAKRNVSVKALEETVKQLRHEQREERKKSAHLQDVIAGVFDNDTNTILFYCICVFVTSFLRNQ